MEKELQKTVLDLKNNSDFIYGKKFSLADRNVRLDCLGFVISVYEILGINKKIPRFSYSENQLKNFVPNNFSDSEVGDYLLFFVKSRNKKRNYSRNFHHLALKFSDKEIAHLHTKGKRISIVDFEEYKFRKNVLTTALLESGELKNLL